MQVRETALVPYGSPETALVPYGSSETALVPYGSSETALVPYGSSETALVPYGSSETALVPYGSSEGAMVPYSEPGYAVQPTMDVPEYVTTSPLYRELTIPRAAEMGLTPPASQTALVRVEEIPELSREDLIDEFLKETAREEAKVKSRMSPEKQLKTKIQKTVVLAVIGFDDDDVDELQSLLEAAGAEGELDGNILYLGTQVDGIRTAPGDFKIKIKKTGALPDLGTFPLLVASPDDLSSLRLCEVLKKYSRPGSLILFDNKSMRGCRSFKSQLMEVGDPIPEYPGFQLFGLPEQ